MTIEAHSKLADFYEGRPPYSKQFFEGAANKLGLSKDSVVLDLCCGRGELASGFAALCKTIYAVDGSQQMLDNSIARPNVNYLLHDVNNDEVVLPELVDHVVIGSAIHWLEPASLGRLLARNLKPGGKVLVTHTMLRTQDRPWFPALRQLDTDHGKTGVGSKTFKDLEGADRLQACGFGKVDGIRLVKPVQFGVDYLYQYQLSYMYADYYEQVSADLEGYRARLAETVAPHLDEAGKLSATLINWGVIFGRVAT